MSSISRINQQGMIHNLGAAGFTLFTALCEMFANSFDAGAKIIVIVVNQDYITFMDDGGGMSAEDLPEKLCTLYNENHSSDTSIGKFGVGAKAALLKLGVGQNVDIMSHNGETLSKFTIPFKDMLDTTGDDVFSCWDDHINKQKTVTDDADLEKYTNDRKTAGLRRQGATFTVPYNDEVKKCLENNFYEHRLSLPRDQRLDAVFGRLMNDDTFKLIDLTHGEDIYPLRPYNYFNDNNTKFYTGIQDCCISVYKKLNNSQQRRYIYKKDEDKKTWLETPAFESTNRYSRCLRPCRSLAGWVEVGHFTLQLGMRKYDKIFDEQNPCLPPTKGLCSYDKNYLSDKSVGTVEDDLSRVAISRNDQIISYLKLDMHKVSSARGDVYNNLKIINLQAYLTYSGGGSHDDPLDKIMMLQSNKTQLNPADFPTELLRMIGCLKNNKFIEIKEHMENTTAKAATKKAAAVANYAATAAANAATAAVNAATAAVNAAADAAANAADADDADDDGAANAADADDDAAAAPVAAVSVAIVEEDEVEEEEEQSEEEQSEEEQSEEEQSEEEHTDISSGETDDREIFVNSENHDIQKPQMEHLAESAKLIKDNFVNPDLFPVRDILLKYLTNLGKQ